MENYDAAVFVAAFVALAIGAFFGMIWFLTLRDKRQDYPFENPDFIHVGITPRQAEALKPLALDLRFMTWIPRHENKSIDATFYAMTREQFMTFFDTVYRHTKIKIATAAKRQESYLKGDTFTLYDMLVGMTEIRKRIDPSQSFPALDFSPPTSSVDRPPTSAG